MKRGGEECSAETDLVGDNIYGKEVRKLRIRNGKKNSWKIRKNENEAWKRKEWGMGIL